MSNVCVCEEIFVVIVKGYVEFLKDVIIDIEKESFWLGIKVMIFMIGLCFLIDFIDGDNYFVIKYVNYNLECVCN